MYRSILITGANGLIGSALVEFLRRECASQPTIYAAGRDTAKLRDRLGDGVVYVEYNAEQPVDFSFAADIIVHCASPASPELFVRKPVETMWSNVFGIRELLEYAHRVKARKVVYVSSSEVYGKATPRETGFREDDYGFVDLLDARSSYPMGKRAAETLCASYAKEYGVNASIVRPGHIYGPTASPNDRRVSSAFALAAARGEPIVLKSSGTSRRSYTHADDCASAIMAVSEKGLAGEAYNIANRKGECTIRQMAEIMADEGGVKLLIDAPNSAEAAAFNPMDNSCLDPSKLESLGWHGLIPYEEGFRLTVRTLRSRL